ncbi:MAG: prephenate dehydrogenase/arogenate dehydrogenase family protein [Pseudomonadota bacterium]
MIRRLCIVGVGLIGGSLARALREAGYCQEVVGSSRSETHLARAVELGVIDRFETNLARAVEGADMIVSCVPLGAMEPVFSAMRAHLAADAVITDAGSSKGSVINAAQQAFGTLPPGFVPGHPIAGTERSGVDASFATLYRGRKVILTPTPASAADAVARVREMWEVTGATVLEMAPDHHDEVLAATSHLPHMLAYNLVDVLGNMQERREMFRYAAGGFRDFTRIASSDPVMWHDICMANREALLEAIARYQDALHELHTRIDAGDSEALMACFSRAKALRDRYVELEGQ